MQSILISKCKKGFARHTSQELRGRATGGWRPSSRLPASRRDHAALVVSRRRLHRMVVAPRSSGVRKRETVREQQIALLCYDSSLAGGQAAVVAHPKQLCRFRIPTNGIRRRPANCRSSRGNRRLPRLLQSPSDFERGTARVERHRRALKRRDLNPSVWSYGIRQAVRKNKNPRCRSTGGS